jgi:hypothetical protein
MKRDLFDYLVYLISLAASITGIIAFYQVVGPNLTEQGKYGVIFLGIFALWFMGHNLYLISKYRKDIRYKNLFEEINLAFAHLHKITRYCNAIDNDNYELHIKYTTEMLKDGLDAFVRAYSDLTGSKCAICIKYLFENSNKMPEVSTLIRDSTSKAKRISKENEKMQHLVLRNDNFKFIFDSIANGTPNFKGYYYSGNLPVEEPFSNSRLDECPNWPPKKLKIRFFDRMYRQLNWPLHYKCIIVVPLLPLVKEEQTIDGLRGFLCLDSPKINAFNKKVDTVILQGIADGLYNKIDILFKMLKKHEENKN